MDPKSSYLLKIRLIGNPKKRRETIHHLLPPPWLQKKNAKGKVKAVEKKKNKAAGKKKKKEVPVPPESPSMCTRSKTPQRSSPAAHTRSKRKLPDLNL